MIHSPLLLLAAASAFALPRPAPAPGGDREGRPSVDPAVLSDEARAAWEADPETFERDHGAALEAHRRWSQDPSLGQAECLEAKKDPRSCMEERTREMSEVVKPSALAVINSYTKLLPRGVSAPLPAAGSERAGAPAPSAPARSGAAPAAAPTPAPSPTPAPRQSGVRFNAPPPAQRQASPAPAAPGGGMTTDETVSWICSIVPCART